MTNKRSVFYTCLIFLSTVISGSFANAQTADKIVAVVGKNRVILQSELEKQVMQIREQDPNFHDTMKCMVLQQMMLSKLMVEQADRDSVVVSEEEVEGQIDNRLRYFIRAYGSKEKLEQATGKTVYQLKEENRDIFREQLLAERMQGQIIQNVKITPAEVRTFFDAIPADSLPFYPATVEMGQIVIDPPVNPELDSYAKQKAIDIRKKIVEGGESFEMLAGIHSNDPGSRDNGGDLGVVNRGDMVPEFSTAAFKLKDGEISPIVRTKFGYHIIQMVRRQGEQGQIRHILIHPEITSVDLRKALDKLDSIRAELITGKLTFQEAVGKYATDDMSKRTGGMITDPQTGSTQIEIEKLDPGMVLMVDSLKPGSYSQPHIFTTETGEKSCRIVYMKERTEPHKANLRDDYSKIQEVALGQKKMQRVEKWLDEKLPTYYIKIDDEYHGCRTMEKWISASTASNTKSKN